MGKPKTNNTSATFLKKFRQGWREKINTHDRKRKKDQERLEEEFLQSERARAAFQSQRPSLKASFRSNTSKSEAKSQELILEDTSMTLEQSLEAAALLLGTYQKEQDLTQAEISKGLQVYHELQRVLSRGTRMGDWMSKPSDFEHKTEFRSTYQSLQEEFAEAESNVAKALAHPAAVRPLSLESIQEVNDFFILDNSLRETTVGAPRGHTLKEKHDILEAMAGTGLEEVILGSFGSKISVDSQVAEQWKRLGKTFDSAWGFSDAYDFEPDPTEDRLWEADADAYDKIDDYYTPPAIPKEKFSKYDLKLLQQASKGFEEANSFKGKRLKRVLKSTESEQGRVPLGLLMMAGYGISNAIIEVDTSLETFNYDKFDTVERCKFLIQWVKTNFAKRQNVKPGEDDSPRVLINLRDFSNYHRSEGGMEECLRLVDALSRLPPAERPFGFIMEEPTGWLFPSEVGRVCRMIRLTMNRAGFTNGRFLCHVHWYFGMAEASQLTALCNGCDGVWAAVCKTGAQTGHACSTMTAVNLYRAGMTSICEKYDLQKMCHAARLVTEISTRQPCPSHEEIYGSQAFDIPYFMTNLPSCRYSIYHVLTKIGVTDRAVRLNEISLPSFVYRAMLYHFGPPEETGWEPEHCKQMHSVIHNHLLTGLSRDYNTALGLGHLYSLVSEKKLPWPMIQIMTEKCTISDTHPVVLEFIYRWNRLCQVYQGKELEPHPAAISKSCMFHGLPAITQPCLEKLPFEFFTADVMRNPVLEPIPRLFKLTVVSLLTNDEKKVQGRRMPIINFYETLLRLKLFLAESESLGVLGQVDDFCIRKNHDFFFGEDHLWLKKKGHERPNIANKILVGQMKFYNKHYIQKGSTAISRCIESTALRIDDNRSVPDDMQTLFRRKSKTALVHDIAERKRRRGSCDFSITSDHQINEAHERILRALLEDDGEDEDLAQKFLEESDNAFEPEDGKKENRQSILEAYISGSRERLRVPTKKGNPDAGDEQPEAPRSYDSKIRRASSSLQKVMSEMKIIEDEETSNGDSDLSMGSDS